MNDDLISRKSLNYKVAKAEEFVWDKITDARTAFQEDLLNPEYISVCKRCMLQLSELTRFKEMIHDEPSISVWNSAERMRGLWIKNDNGTYSCSICTTWIPEERRPYARYCLHCGAEMRDSVRIAEQNGA